MKRIFTSIIVTLTCSLSAQVGINTETPHPDVVLDANGKIRIQDIPTTTNAQYLLVEGSDGIVNKILLTDIQLQHGNCPHLIRSQSSGYYLKFHSNSSIPNPNDNVTIQNKTFVSGGAWIESNTYYFSYNNTTGQPININNFEINFSGLICTYN